MPTATVTSKGQTTIPKEIRDYLKLHPGDQIDFIAADDGTVTLVPAMIDVTDLKAVLHRKGMKAVSVEKMRAVVKRRAAMSLK
jgi:AbrB family looped-hinge helix DNA binding protein